MNSRWSWIFIPLVLLHQGTLVVHAINGDDTNTQSHRSRALESDTNTASTPKGHSNSVGAIVGGILGALCFILLVVFLYLHYRQRQAIAQLEDGIDSPTPNSRRWFSRFGRFRRDDSLPEFSDKDVTLVDEKLSSLPRYMRANSAFEREIPPTPSPTGFIDRPLPPAPAVPRSAHLAPGKADIMLSVPSSAPLTRSGRTDRSNRRRVQVSAQPGRQMVSSPLANNAGRKRDLLPNLFRFGGKAPPPVQERQRIHLPPGLAEATPDELARRMQEKQRAMAVLEAKSRVHIHHAHSGSISSVSSTSTACAVDVKIQKDLAELRQEVKVLHELLPEGPPPIYNKAF